MRVEQKFIAFDGKEFKTEKECVEYEKSIDNKLKDIIPTLKIIQKMCDVKMHCKDCVFYDKTIEECIFTGNIPVWWGLDRIGS